MSRSFAFRAWVLLTVKRAAFLDEFCVYAPGSYWIEPSVKGHLLPASVFAEIIFFKMRALRPLAGRRAIWGDASLGKSKGVRPVWIFVVVEGCIGIAPYLWVDLQDDDIRVGIWRTHFVLRSRVIDFLLFLLVRLILFDLGASLIVLDLSKLLKSSLPW